MTVKQIGRKYALTTGLCPMCEDCPDGCPILTPKDSRNITTNADRIRSMSDMELAEISVHYDSDRDGFYCPDGSFCTDEDSALSFALDWLNKPVKEE